MRNDQRLKVIVVIMGSIASQGNASGWINGCSRARIIYLYDLSFNLLG